MRRIRAVAAGALVLAAAAGNAQSASPFAPPVFHVAPLVAQGLGGTAYDLSAAAGGGDYYLSRLEFPAVPLEAGIIAGVRVDRDGHRQLDVSAGFSHSTLPITGTMNDSDWYQPAGLPPLQWSYTESTDSAVTWAAWADAAWTVASLGGSTLAVSASYRFSNAAHTETGIQGWQYAWNSGAGAYDLFPVADTTTRALTYSLAVHTLGIGLVGTMVPFDGLDIAFSALWSPVYVFDSDDHLLRSKLSTSQGLGNGVRAGLRADIALPLVLGGVSTHASLEGSVAWFRVDTTQRQYWYGTLDAGVPQGTLITGVGHVVTGLTYRLGAALGFSFPGGAR